mgnify:CR=1 FL=1
MRIDLTQNGTYRPYGLSAAPLVRPVSETPDAREKVREQVLAAKGVDSLSLYRMSSQDRIRIEAAVSNETALRTRIAQSQGLAKVVDLSV